jgi:Lrp/AsnC family transcriptional regulator, leucine-responsive regulatory protein
MGRRFNFNSSELQLIRLESLHSAPQSRGKNMKDAELDSIDKNILIELSKDARMPFAELGRRVGLSPSASNERVRQLESLGVIQGYRASIDFKALGFRITAFIRLTCDGQRYRPFLKFLNSLDSVQECHHLTGGDAFLLKVILTSTEELERMIEKLLPYGMPTTSLVLSTPLNRSQDAHVLDKLLTKAVGRQDAENG